jgi:hypothetical protein
VPFAFARARSRLDRSPRPNEARSRRDARATSASRLADDRAAPEAVARRFSLARAGGGEGLGASDARTLAAARAGDVCVVPRGRSRSRTRIGERERAGENSRRRFGSAGHI